MIHGVLVAGPALERFAIRGPFLVTAAILLFAATIRPLGLVISTFLLVVVSASASPEVHGKRWIETVIWAAVLSAFCAVLFPNVLNLPMQLWPRSSDRSRVRAMQDLLANLALGFIGRGEPDRISVCACSACWSAR